MTKTPFLFAMAVAGLLLAGPVRAATATLAMIAEVQIALDRGDAQQAADLADAALKQEGTGQGERGRLLLYRGLAQELLGAPAEAMGDFTQALATNALLPDERAQALLQRGFLRDGLGRLKEAAGDYTAVIALKGEGLATALNNRANIHRRQNRLAQARRDYLAALAAGGGKSQYSYYGLGQIAEAQHDAQAARGFYAKAAAADPAYGLATERLAALGGPPEGVLADGGPVILRPPAGRNADAARGFETVAEAAQESDGSIMLHPPRAPRDAQRSHVPARTTPPAVAISTGGLTLRPALDQHPAALLGGAEVQLGAWRTEAEAHAGWDKAKARAGEVLQGLSPHILAADVPGKGRYYRLRVSPGAGQTRAEFCASLTEIDLACFPVRD